MSDDIAPLYIPEWAIAEATELLEVGCDLPTKDGRRTGNAHILDIGYSRHTGDLLYLIITDAGNTFNMDAAEVKERFHPPKYVSSVENILINFNRGRPDPRIVFQGRCLKEIPID